MTGMTPACGTKETCKMMLLAMIGLGILAFVAMYKFIDFCDRV